MWKNSSKYVLLCLTFSVFFVLIGCSYREFEDSIRHKDAEGNDDYENRVEIPMENDGEPLEGYEETVNKERENAAGKVGDSIQVDFWMDPEGALQYTLEKVEMGIDIEALGVSVEDFRDASILEETGQIKESADCQLLVATITVKNVNIDTKAVQEEIEGEYPFFIETFAGSESNILDPDGPFLLEACCFVNHPEKMQDFYKFTLEEGEELSTKVGWLVTNAMLEEPFYYIISGGQATEFYQYFKLN